MAIVEPVPAADQPCFLASGDTALIVEFGDRVDQRLSGLVVALAHRLEQAAIPGVVEMVPTFSSLMVHYDPLRTTHAEVARRNQPLLDAHEVVSPVARRWTIPVCYDPAFALDLVDDCLRTTPRADSAISCTSARARSIEARASRSAASTRAMAVSASAFRTFGSIIDVYRFQRHDRVTSMSRGRAVAG